MKSLCPIKAKFAGDVTGYWGCMEKIDVSFIVQIVAHHEVWPKTILYTWY